MSWIGGLAEWRVGNLVFLSVAFTWKLEEAHDRAVFARAQGLKVLAGGPALFLVQNKHKLADVAEIGAHAPDAIIHHNQLATFASRGCPVGCWFCIVPPMEGREFTLIPDFPVRPILCDNNLSALDPKYQDHIIARYNAEKVKMIDANSGFEPRTFTPDVFQRWRPLVRAGGGPWRFAYDDMQERKEVLAVMEMLKDEPQARKRVYVLIGNEPVAECMQRIQEVIGHGCEPHVQPVIKLNATERKPWVRFDWTERDLRKTARWANGRYWKYTDLAGFDPNRPGKAERYDEQQGLFV